MWYKVKELSSKGLNKSQISVELEINRGTVRRYLLMDETNEKLLTLNYYMYT